MLACMSIPVRAVAFAVIAVCVGLAWYVLHLWSPARQAELHTLNLLRRASSRDWVAAERMMSPDYRDDWGHDRAGAVEDAKLVFGHFFVLEIAPLEPPRVVADSGTAALSLRVGVFGSGTPVAAAVMDEVRGLREPFVFHWRKSGPWPWQWELSGAGQPELAARYPRQASLGASMAARTSAVPSKPINPVLSTAW